MDPLTNVDKEHVVKASVLLRLARAVNLGRSDSVVRFSLSSRSGSVAMKLIPRGKAGVDLELWAIEKERDYFREVFGRALSAAAA